MVVFVVAAAYAAKIGSVAIVKHRRGRHQREELEKEKELQQDDSPKSPNPAVVPSERKTIENGPQRRSFRWRRRPEKATASLQEEPTILVDSVVSQSEGEHEVEILHGTGRSIETAHRRERIISGRSLVDSSERFYECFQKRLSLKEVVDGGKADSNNVLETANTSNVSDTEDTQRTMEKSDRFYECAGNYKRRASKEDEMPAILEGEKEKVELSICKHENERYMARSERYFNCCEQGS